MITYQLTPRDFRGVGAVGILYFFVLRDFRGGGVKKAPFITIVSREFHACSVFAGTLSRDGIQDGQKV